jgi:hypothetical protein
MENEKGFDLILQERRRQIEVEGWTSDHDDNHESGEIGRAGACYETAALHDNPKISHTWPWATEWWKPKDKLKNLTRAGALFLAESEKQKMLGDTIKADYWFSRATIVAKRIEQMENEKTAIERWVEYMNTAVLMPAVAICCEEYAAQQTASLQSELAASERIRMSDAQSHIREANALRGRIEQLQSELSALQESNKKLVEVLHTANQMLISYNMRHPNEEQCLVGKSNEQALSEIVHALSKESNKE